MLGEDYGIIAGADLCLKFEIPYALCHRMLLSNEGALVAQINDLRLLNTTCIYENFNGGYICVLFVLVQNCVCVDGTSTKLRIPKCTLSPPAGNIYLPRQMSKTLNDSGNRTLPALTDGRQQSIREQIVTKNTSALTETLLLINGSVL